MQPPSMLKLISQRRHCLNGSSLPSASSIKSTAFTYVVAYGKFETILKGKLLHCVHYRFERAGATCRADTSTYLGLVIISFFLALGNQSRASREDTSLVSLIWGSLRSTSLWIPVSVERVLSSLTVVPCAVQKAWMKSQCYQHQHPLLELNFRHLFCPLRPHLYSMRCAVCCGVSRHSNAGWDCDMIALFVLNAFRWCRYTLLPERLCM